MSGTTVVEWTKRRVQTASTRRLFDFRTPMTPHGAEGTFGRSHEPRLAPDTGPPRAIPRPSARVPCGTTAWRETAPGPVVGLQTPYTAPQGHTAGRHYNTLTW